MAQPYGRPSHFFSLEQLAHLPPPQWLIEDMFEAESTVMLAGPPGHYKSFLALDWMLSITTGRSWNGKKVKQSKVLYVLGEGKASLYKRISAWLAYHKPSPEEMGRIATDFRVGFEVPQMADGSSVDTLLANLASDGFTPNVIVIDTFARSFVGKDENSPADTGLWIESAERLRNLGYTVIFLHHTKKNTEFGLQYRGSSALMGAMDTAMTMGKDTKTGIATLVVSKQKDHEEGHPMHFKAERVTAYWGTKAMKEPGMVLLPTIQLDERFSDAYRKDEEAMDAILKDASFASDRSRARSLALSTGMNENTAHTRLRRRRKELNLGEDLGGGELLIPSDSNPDSTTPVNQQVNQVEVLSHQ
jgi:RecA-family ATPase